MLKVSSFLRKNTLAISASALAALVAASALARFVLPENAASDALYNKPVWAGGLASGSNDSHTNATALTSASYLMPQEKLETLAAASEPVCPSDTSCPPKPEKTSHPPRKPQQRQAAAAPALAPVSAKRQLIASAQDVKPIDAPPQEPKQQTGPSKSAGWLDWSKISDHLPKTETLLKPFGVVSDAVSGLIKRF